jgi:cbb3-type cytochrome c oxidase subunit III
MRLPTALLAASLALFVASFGTAVSARTRPHHAGQQHEAGEHHHPAAAAIKNPVSADAASIAAGKKIFSARCADCHGDTGAGDGMEGEGMDPPPANLADATWKHGSTDGEIFTVIKNGVKGTGMKSFGSKLTTTEIWNVVNYIHTLHQ